MDPRWLLLTDFASKYRISVSTLRRRIKTGAQPYRFEGGRYYLPDQLGSNSFEETVRAEPAAKPLTVTAADRSVIKPTAHSTTQVTSQVAPQSAAAVLAASMTAGDEPLITTTSKLLNELKQAYTLILHEKEEQILYFREEIADLKTLVRVLESENARLVNDRDRQRVEQPERVKNPFGTA